jgi:hypothetical protein
MTNLQQRLDLKEKLEKMRESQYSTLLKQYEEKTANTNISNNIT